MVSAAETRCVYPHSYFLNSHSLLFPHPLLASLKHASELPGQNLEATIHYVAERMQPYVERRAPIPLRTLGFIAFGGARGRGACAHCVLCHVPTSVVESIILYLEAALADTIHEQQGRKPPQTAVLDALVNVATYKYKELYERYYELTLQVRRGIEGAGARGGGARKRGVHGLTPPSPSSRLSSLSYPRPISSAPRGRAPATFPTSTTFCFTC